MVPIQRSAKALATGVRIGVLRILRSSVRKTSSKASTSWLPGSRTRARVLVSWLRWRCHRLWAAWVVQAPVGLALTPAKKTWRLGMWIKNST